MTLVMSCRCLSQSYVGRSIGGECVLSVTKETSHIIAFCLILSYLLHTVLHIICKALLACVVGEQSRAEWRTAGQPSNRVAATPRPFSHIPFVETAPTENSNQESERHHHANRRCPVGRPANWGPLVGRPANWESLVGGPANWGPLVGRPANWEPPSWETCQLGIPGWRHAAPMRDGSSSLPPLSAAASWSLPSGAGCRSTGGTTATTGATFRRSYACRIPRPSPAPRVSRAQSRL